MSSMIPFELAHRISAGLLSFPVTHFDERGESADEHYREHIAWISNIVRQRYSRPAVPESTFR